MGLLAYRSREALSYRILLPRTICGIETSHHSEQSQYLSSINRKAVMAQEHNHQRSHCAAPLTAQTKRREPTERRSSLVIKGGKPQPAVVTTSLDGDDDDDDDLRKKLQCTKTASNRTGFVETPNCEAPQVILYPTSEDADLDSENKHQICCRKSHDTRGRTTSIENSRTGHNLQKFIYLHVHDHDDVSEMQSGEMSEQIRRPRSRSPLRLSSGYDRWNLFDKPIIRPGCPLLSVTNTDNETKYPDDLYYYPDDFNDDDDDDDYDSD